MPDIVMHNKMGSLTLEALPDAISGTIQDDVFRFAVNGPDPYFTYRFYCPWQRQIRHRGTVMHTERTGAFLTTLTARCANAEDETLRQALFSLLAGWVCHYAYDAEAHPYINALANGRPGMHRAIEYTLDRIELAQAGHDLATRPITSLYFPPYPSDSVSRELAAVMREIYGWSDDAQTFRAAWRDMRSFYRLAEDPHGWLWKLTAHAGRYASLSYRSRLCDGMDVMNLQRQSAGFQETFAELTQKAALQAAGMIQACDSCIRGAMTPDDLRVIIGNRSYSTGLPVEDGKR